MKKSYRSEEDLSKIGKAIRERETERVDNIMSGTRLLAVYSMKEPPVAIIYSKKREVTTPFETYDVIGREEDIRKLEQEVGIEGKLKQE